MLKVPEFEDLAPDTEYKGSNCHYPKDNVSAPQRLLQIHHTSGINPTVRIVKLSDDELKKYIEDNLRFNTRIDVWAYDASFRSVTTTEQFNVEL